MNARDLEEAEMLAELWAKEQFEDFLEVWEDVPPMPIELEDMDNAQQESAY